RSTQRRTASRCGLCELCGSYAQNAVFCSSSQARTQPECEVLPVIRRVPAVYSPATILVLPAHTLASVTEDERMKRSLIAAVALVAFAAVSSAQAPLYRVMPLWPQPLPNHWVLGSVTGVAVDAQDHVWIAHRGADSLEANEKGVMANPPTSTLCCVAAPFILELDAAGKVLSHIGGPGQGYQWPQSPGAIAVDAKGNVWIAAAGLDPAPPGGRGRGTVDPDAVGGGRARGGAAEPAARGAGADAARGTAGRGRGGPPAPAGPPDAHVLKFARNGTFLLQIGSPGKMEGPDSQTTLNRPAAVAVDTAANEVFVADSGNHRIAVFDAQTGAYKRHWGAYGEKPTAAGGGPYDPGAPPARQWAISAAADACPDNFWPSAPSPSIRAATCTRESSTMESVYKSGWQGGNAGERRCNVSCSLPLRFSPQRPAWV